MAIRHEAELGELQFALKPIAAGRGRGQGAANQVNGFVDPSVLDQLERSVQTSVTSSAASSRGSGTYGCIGGGS